MRSVKGDTARIRRIGRKPGDARFEWKVSRFSGIVILSV